MDNLEKTEERSLNLAPAIHGGILNGKFSDGATMYFIRALLVSAVLLACSLSGYAQYYRGMLNDGKSSGSSCIVLEDGSIVTLGSSGAGESNDFLLIRHNSQLNVQWAKMYGGAAYERGSSLARTGSGGFLLVGQTRSFGAGRDDILLVNVDKDGNLLWARTYGGPEDDAAYTVRAVQGDGFLISGQTRSFGSRSWAAFLLRINEQGDPRWFRLYDNWNTDAASDFEQTSDGGFIVTGWTYMVGAGMHDVLVFKTDGNGNLLWTRIFGGPRDDGGHSVHQIPGGGYIINADTHSFGRGSSDALIARLSEKGYLLWVFTIGRDGEDGFRKSMLDSDTTVVLAGWLTDTHLNQKEVFLGRISIAGNVLYLGSVRDGISGHATNFAKLKRNHFVLTGERLIHSESNLLIAEAEIPVRGRSSDYEAEVLSAQIQDADIAMPTRAIQFFPQDASVQTSSLTPAVSQDKGRLASLATNVSPQSSPSVGEYEVVPPDSGEFILSRIAKIAAAKKTLQGQIPCDFSAADKELEKAEAILRIGDFERSLLSLWKAESLLTSAPCGPVRIEELTALGSYYDHKRLELTGTVVGRDPSTSGDGYMLRVSDNTGEIVAFFPGSLREIAADDRVHIEGSYSHSEGILLANTVDKVDSAGAMGLLVAALAMFIAASIVVYRILKKRSAQKAAS